jgi:Myo-inositol oxygenase
VIVLNYEYDISPPGSYDHGACWSRHSPAVTIRKRSLRSASISRCCARASRTAFRPGHRFTLSTPTHKPNCGLENIHLSFGHDGYIAEVMKPYLLDEVLYMLRFHSFDA